VACRRRGMECKSGRLARDEVEASAVSGMPTVKRSLAHMLAATVCAAALVLGGSFLASPACAQAGACTQSCQSAYAQCYKDSGSNRRVCEAQLQQCLAGCINKR
jgi:hypothetical protein